MFKRTGKKEPFKGADKNNLSENLFELVDSGEITLCLLYTSDAADEL